MTYKRNRSFSCECENISARDNTRARIFDGSFDIVNDIKTPSGVNVWSCKFLTQYG